MTRPITKAAFAEAFAQSGDMSKKDAAAALDALSATITQILKDGNSVTIPHVVTLGSRHVEARKGRNPATGEPMDLPAKTLPTTKLSKSLKDAVNQS